MNSKLLRLGLACVVFVGLTACGDDPPVVADDGGAGDAGGLDGGTSPDAGGGGEACGTLDTSTRFPQVPAACMPRCAATTLTEYNACSSATCRRATLEEDTTPDANVSADGTLVPIGCSGCFSLQSNSCVYEICPDEKTADYDCAAIDPATADSRCTSEAMAVNACIEANVSEYQSCLSMRARPCFGTAGGVAAGGAGSGSGAAPSFSIEELRAAARFRIAH